MNGWGIGCLSSPGFADEEWLGGPVTNPVGHAIDGDIDPQVESGGVIRWAAGVIAPGVEFTAIDSGEHNRALNGCAQEEHRAVGGIDHHETAGAEVWNEILRAAGLIASTLAAVD